MVPWLVLSYISLELCDKLFFVLSHGQEIQKRGDASVEESYELAFAMPEEYFEM